jgi:hypothetical protein
MTGYRTTNGSMTAIEVCLFLLRLRVTADAGNWRLAEAQNTEGDRVEISVAPTEVQERIYRRVHKKEPAQNFAECVGK